MATLVIVTHEFDIFTYRPDAHSPVTSSYLLFDVVHRLESFGHRIRVSRGPNAVPGDAALLHVDATIVADEYLALQSHYPRTLNFATADISKRAISRLIVGRDDGWSGPVIVKANLNSRGRMELRHNQLARRAGRPLPHPGVVDGGAPYRIYDSAADVPEEDWADPALVIERFIPEIDPDGGYVLRTWVFMGSRERCTRQVSPDPVVKADDVVRYAPDEVPPELRAERERLGFDFGKFDFIMVDGRPVLLDANRTPGVANAILPLMKAGVPALAEGLDALLRG